MTKQDTGLTKLVRTGQDIEMSPTAGSDLLIPRLDMRSWKTASEEGWDMGLLVVPLEKKRLSKRRGRIFEIER